MPRATFGCGPAAIDNVRSDVAPVSEVEVHIPVDVSHAYRDVEPNVTEMPMIDNIWPDVAPERG